MARLCILFSILWINIQGIAQIKINESSASNTTIISDEDGDYPDWIELYNAGSQVEDLSNYFISDNGALPFKWRIPSVSLHPGSYQLIYCSEKNRFRHVDHWETAVMESDTWQYIVPSSEPPASWKLAGFTNGLWSTGTGGIGLGDSDDNTILPNGTSRVYLRHEFSVSDTSLISAAAFHIDYDDGYIAFLNGIPIARSNVPSVPDFTSVATNSREAVMYTGGLPELKMIPLDTLRMALRNGMNVLAIQVYNINATSSDMTARPFLSFGIKNTTVTYRPTPSWFNLSTTLPLHSNFKLSSGESLTIRTSSGALVDQLVLPSMMTDHSYGSLPNGQSTRKYFSTPTPGMANSAVQSFDDYCRDSIRFSLPAGFYTGSVSIALSGSAVIRYTVDGSIPNLSSPLYVSPILITGTTVIRAACFSSLGPPRSVFTSTYLLNKSTSIPVFSISTTPALLFDPVSGIYMMGPDAEPNAPHFGANFWEETEIPIHVEYFETNTLRYINQDAALRISGNYSRANDQKSFVLKAYQRFGDGDFSHPFFPDKDITDFTQIVLRNSGGDFNYMHFRDGFIHKAIGANTNLDYQDFRPTAVFINGEYWGILNLREKINEHFVEDNSGIDAERIDLTETWGTALEGTNNIWDLQWWATNRDLSQEANYKVVADSFDLDNLVDYYAAQIFISNWDWPQNNVKYWRDREGNRKWRMILWDTDLSLGLYDLNEVTYNALSNVVDSDDATKNPVTDIFKNMLDYIPFRNRFVNRYADLLNTVFQPTFLDHYLYALKDTIDEEMEEHSIRWNRWKNFDNAVREADDFYTARVPIARNEIRAQFQLVKQVNVTLQVLPAGSGTIQINSVVPSSYPWTGVYFDGVPVTITVLPAPGCTFSHWSIPGLPSNNSSTNRLILNISNLSQTITANFTGVAQPVRIAVSEINYRSSLFKNSGDWVELHNYGSTSMDLSLWKIRDSKTYHSFLIPQGTVVPASGYLVLYSDATLFQQRHPTIGNAIGPIGFDWSNEGEKIELITPTGATYLSFSYSNQMPWPIEGNGTGYTIQLVNPTAPPALSSSWEVGCMEGTPGRASLPGCVTSSIDPVQFHSFTLYPNPVSDILYIQTQDIEPFTYQIETVDGRLVYISPEMHSTMTEVPIRSLPAGMYLVRILIGTNTLVRKIIVQHHGL